MPKTKWGSVIFTAYKFFDSKEPVSYTHLDVYKRQDNGVTAEGISSAPNSVTLSQVIKMTRHKTGMSALAHYFGNEVVVADMGIDTDRPIPGVLDRKVRRSTGNIAREPAMTRQQALQALETGMELAAQAAADGVQALGIGEKMCIRDSFRGSGLRRRFPVLLRYRLVREMCIRDRVFSSACRVNLSPLTWHTGHSAGGFSPS